MRRIMLIGLSIIIALSAQAQVESNDTTHYPKEKLLLRVKNDGVIAGKTIWQAYKRPFSWEKKEWLIFGGVMAFSAGISFLDEPIYDYYEVNRDTNPFLSDVADIGDFMGQPENNYPFMLTVWGLGVLTNSEWLRDTGIMIFASVTTSGLIQTALKDIVGRARPGANEGPYSFKPFGGSAYHSFPSGHTMLALATSYILAHQIDFLPARIAVFAIPVITGWSRIHDGAHFLSDIVLGSALGIAFAESVLNLYPKIKAMQRGEGTNLSLMPTGNGFRLVYRF